MEEFDSSENNTQHIRFAMQQNMYLTLKVNGTRSGWIPKTLAAIKRNDDSIVVTVPKPFKDSPPMFRYYFIHSKD
ncbi:unnamed protein product [Rodentolepis nana]|uniref:SH2 domain-containing protein n=1 Tax=Rodentolepis nana TaxID=102285 RepID=A0A0R3TVD8_RODNA|nr:unnamed protein product [Rodentolepis nana]